MLHRREIWNEWSTNWRSFKNRDVKENFWAEESRKRDRMIQQPEQE